MQAAQTPIAEAGAAQMYLSVVVDGILYKSRLNLCRKGCADVAALRTSRL
jgi:hypothetical protein